MKSTLSPKATPVVASAPKVSPHELVNQIVADLGVCLLGVDKGGSLVFKPFKQLSMPRQQVLQTILQRLANNATISAAMSGRISAITLV